MDVTLPFVQPIVNKIAALYTDFSGKLTPTRAGYLDNLPNLVENAALAVDVGHVTDAPALNTSLFAGMQELYSELVSLSGDLAILASAEQIRTIMQPGYTSAILLSAANAPTRLSSSTTIAWSGGAVGQYLHTAKKFGLNLPSQAMVPLYGSLNGTSTGIGQVNSPATQGTLALTLNTTYPTSAAVGQAVISFGDPSGSNWWGDRKSVV